MAAPPNLTVSPSTDLSPTTTPARGAEMRNFLQARLQKNRAPPLVHSWDFWHDRQDRSSSSSNPNPQNPRTTSPASPGGTPPIPQTPTDYENRLILLASVSDIKSFWSLFNNFDLALLPLRDSIHLFKRGVKPIWEDPRNLRGGAWTFRVPKTLAPEFWKVVCMLAIGEALQAAVEEEGVTSFRDDICGVSLGVRYGSCLIQVWNRDGGHEAGIQRVLETVVGGLGEGFELREGAVYYKRHREHAAFAADAGVVEGEGEGAGAV